MTRGASGSGEKGLGPRRLRHCGHCAGGCGTTKPVCPVGSEHYRVRQAVEDWLKHGQATAGDSTRTKNRHLCESHVLPHLGERKLRDLSAEEVDQWLATLSHTLSSSTLGQVRSCLSRSVRRAMKRNLVERNVVELCDVPRGRDGRRSKSLTLDQARAVLTETRDDPLHCYIVVSLLTGARTEELRALRWEHVHLDGTMRGKERSLPYVRYGGRFGQVATQRPASRAGLWPCLPGGVGAC